MSRITGTMVEEMIPPRKKLRGDSLVLRVQGVNLGAVSTVEPKNRATFESLMSSGHCVLTVIGSSVGLQMGFRRTITKDT